MRHWLSLWIVLTLLSVALSGCSGKGSTEGGNEPSAADAAANTYDRAIGNRGHRVTGGLTGPATALGEDSAVQFDILDVAQADTDPPQDKASLVLDAKEPALNVQATLRSMASGATANSSADHFSGTARNVKIFGTTGVGPSDLPETTAYLFTVGFANLKVGDVVQSKRVVYVAVTDALRDASMAPLSAPDSSNLQLHVIVPGATMGLQPVDGVPGGFLYYYFEDVGLSKLNDEEKGKIGSSLAAPEKKNLPPVAEGKILVAGKPASSAVQEGKSKANVTVTFDASASTDEDGTVTRWVWRIFELTNVTYDRPAETPAVVQGQTVDYNFTQAGPKIINLTVVDNQGGTDTFLINFYVDFHSKAPGGGSAHSQGPIGGNECLPSVNCFQNTSVIQPGVVSATYTVSTRGTGVTLTNVHIDVYAPGKSDPAVDTPIKAGEGMTVTVTAADFKTAGRFEVFVWYEASTSAGGADQMPLTNDSIYDLEMSVTYTPKV